MRESDIPEISEAAEPNPGWKIRIGGSKKAAKILLSDAERPVLIRNVPGWRCKRVTTPTCQPIDF